MPVTVRGTDILFDNGTTQSSVTSPLTTGITGTGSVGDVGIFLCTSATATNPGGTVSGSLLFRISSLVMSNTTDPVTFRSFSPGGDYRNRTTAFTYLRANFSPMTGTWRVLSAVGATYVSDGYGTATSIPFTFAIRIA